MVGAIGTRDILFHPLVTIRAFGWRIYFRAVFESRGDTFLSVLERGGAFAAPPGPNEGELIERCVRLELQAAAIYRTLAERLARLVPLSAFLHELADEENQHAHLLRLCKMFARKRQSPSKSPSPWQDYVPLLERQMQGVAASLDEIESMDDVVRLILQTETSEINLVFLGVVRETDSPFVRKLGPFRNAVKKHINRICKAITRLTPGAAPACKDLRAKLR